MAQLKQDQFEEHLANVCKKLTKEMQTNPKAFKTSGDLEKRARELFSKIVVQHGLKIDIAPPAQDFPDIIIGKYGVEVKFTLNNTWRSVANSISEGSKNAHVEQIYILFGKMGGTPEVRWAKYDDCVNHLRTSHVPRFEVEMLGRGSLFSKLQITYKDFAALDINEKMKYARRYARSRLRPDENFWWIESRTEPITEYHTELRLFPTLSAIEKNRLMLECVLLFPSIVHPISARKEHAYSVHLLKYHNVFCPSVSTLIESEKLDESIAASEVLAKLKNSKIKIIELCNTLPSNYFHQYWKQSLPTEDRFPKWLELASNHFSKFNLDRKISDVI
ncbi:MAG: restriction endonuclease [Pseudobdellovibrio sp.]